MDNCGIYMLYSELDSRVYIGSSKNLKRRLCRHKSELKVNKHKNRHLQRFVNKYGINSIKTKILLNCKEEELIKLETEKIKEFNSIITGFNQADPNKVYITEEHRKNIANARRVCKYNKIINVIKDNNIIFKGYISEIENKFNIDKSSVYKILKGKRKLHKKLTFLISE